jgi:hypothetical protein
MAQILMPVFTLVAFVCPKNSTNISQDSSANEWRYGGDGAQDSGRSCHGGGVG